MNSAIRIITTGGTIDALPNYHFERKAEFNATNLPQLIAMARLSKKIVHEGLMQKDSSLMTDDDRAQIAERCFAAPEERIVITHGTDTLRETAIFLADKNIPKTIVLVGSFVPFSQENSDASFNVGFALAASQTLQTGVWIAMGGEIFLPREARKNIEKQIFERVEA